MRVENRYNFGLQNSYSVHTSKQGYYNLKYEPNSVSFGMNTNKDGIISQFKDFILSIVNPKAAQAKKEALEAQRKAENEARALEYEQKMMGKREKALEEARILLGDWRARHAGLFQERKFVDNTGDIILCEKECNPELLAKADKLVRPDSWEYTLANFGGHLGYFTTKPAGQLIRHIQSNEVYVTGLGGWCPPNQDTDFRDTMWRVRYRYTHRVYPTKNDASCPCTVLSCGYRPDAIRPPGVNFVIEGIIPLKHLQQIKKNIVEKGLWQNYIEKEDQDAHIAIYNEIINYLNNIR